MEAFREFLLAYRPQHFGVALPLNLIICTVLMRFTVNWMAKSEQKATWKECAICAVLLYVIGAAAAYLMVFPSALIFVGAILFWLIASIAVIQGTFELPDGGFGILFLYLLVLTATHGLIRLFI